MNEVFAVTNLVDLVAGLIIIAIGLVSVYLVFVGYRFTIKALDDVYGSGGLEPDDRIYDSEFDTAAEWWDSLDSTEQCRIEKDSG